MEIDEKESHLISECVKIAQAGYKQTQYGSHNSTCTRYVTAHTEMV